MVEVYTSTMVEMNVRELIMGTTGEHRSPPNEEHRPWSDHLSETCCILLRVTHYSIKIQVNMLWKMLTVAILAQGVSLTGAQNYGTCKEPTVEQRLLADDVRYASPFYVIGLPRNPDTEQMDNVCYTYFENGAAFFHVMSITYKNGSNVYHKYSKGDISNRIGLAEANGISGSQCQYHDYTLTPICNQSVFILYRCFRKGNCADDIDIGVTPGVDVRVILAATPNVSKACLTEIQASVRDTSKLRGGDYVIFPQNLKPKCVTKYNNYNSIGNNRAAGFQEVTDEYVGDRFGGNSGLPSAPEPFNAVQTQGQQNPAAASPAREQWAQQPQSSTSFNPYGSNVKPGNSNAKPGQPTTPFPTWVKNNGQWNLGSAPWDQTSQTAQHFHIWQSTTGGVKTTTAAKNPNVFYHIHSWDNPPPGCCRCN